MMSSILPLPEDIDEIGFAGFLRGKSVPMVRAKTLNMNVPANAEIVLEGVVPAKERRLEGPFGDHFGHYSEAAEFPVFHIQRITTTQELDLCGNRGGKAAAGRQVSGHCCGRDGRTAHQADSSQCRGPRSIRRRRVSQPAGRVGEGTSSEGSFEDGYGSAGHRPALADKGSGAGRCRIGIRKTSARCLRDIGQRFDPEDHMWLLPFAPLDTLDFTSFTMHVGSKLVLDACGPVMRPERTGPCRRTLPDRSADREDGSCWRVDFLFLRSAKEDAPSWRT